MSVSTLILNEFVTSKDSCFCACTASNESSYEALEYDDEPVNVGGVVVDDDIVCAFTKSL